ncbi:MAG: adenylate/guanylate cyclase domain-containing protein, partial [Nitratireductor sp.]|nr:adenylate/guanylate cyclase domain-containing protein [Nitratireductor sp.]
MQRRLAAIFAADMVGYSRLIGMDEEGTIARQRALRQSIVDPNLQENAGRIVKTTGDGLLVEFASAIDAVRCAVAIQELVARHEEELPVDQRIRYRVGINLDDVVVDGDDLLGDGVNIAARLEGIAEPGGICISEMVHSHVRARLDARFEDLGEQNVKNIARPVRAWRWIRPNTQESTQEGTRLGAQEKEGSRIGAGGAVDSGKPSIAVLPFTNMSGDAEQEYFADGMAEDIITELSKMPWFFVVARNTTFTYKGRAVDVKAVGAELGVSYVLEGSVRKAGNRLRITAQLIDAATGNHVWADRYDREITDLFDIQDEITQAIIGAVAPEFLSSEIRKSQHKDPSQLGAWECVMRGRSL